MCGIVGLIGKNNQKITPDIIKKMTDTISHRGPDAEGVLVEGSIGLGHRRLSILDLSDQGNQPMNSQDGRFCLVFNGEIYNYLEIRKNLESKGTKFFTGTDTEVIIESFREWGDKCTERFNGMWSFCLYDRHEQLLFMSRDRMGVKPLYILDRDDYLVFASEIKSILKVFPEERVVDVVQVARYLKGIQEDCDEHTFYSNIKIFPVASNMLFKLVDSTYNIRKYWEVDPVFFAKKWKTNKPVKTLRTLLIDSIKLRLRADVNVGSSLSGGLDSSAIVEITSKELKKKLETFSSIYDEKNYNEKEFIDCVNNDAQTTAHHVFPDENKDVLEELKQLMYYHDCPPHCASPFSGYNVYKMARNHVKVLMDGQGADELFVGYYYYINDYIKESIKDRRWLRKIRALKIIAEVSEIWKGQRIISDELVLKTLGVNLYKKYDRELMRTMPRDWHSDKELYSERLNEIDLDICNSDETSVTEGILRSQYHDQFHGILPRILHDVDRNSMAHSLEVRLPFLDYRLIEFSYSLSPQYKYRNGWTKYILRRTVRPFMPKKIWSRRNKMGFPAPFEKWMKEEKYKDRIKAYLMQLSSRGLLNKNYLMKLYEDQLNGRRNEPDMIFRFMMLEMWLQCEIDKEDYKWRLA